MLRQNTGLLFFGMMALFLTEQSFSNPVGADAALRLTDDVSRINRQGVVLDASASQISEEEIKGVSANGRLQIERQGIVANLPSSQSAAIAGGANCPQGSAPAGGQSSPEARSVPVRLDLEIRTYIVGGFSNNGVRTPYENANFDPYLRSIIGWQTNRNRTDGKTMSEAHDEIMRNGFGYYGGRPVDPSLSDDVYDTILLDRLIRATGAERDALYAEAGRTMSFDRQIAFIAKLGGALSANYDDNRASQAIGATAIPSCEDMISGLGGSEPLGVCRDMHLCMANILQKMGNNGNVYGISFASPGNYHVTLVATDPNNPNRIHNINYDQHNVVSDRSGIAALAQDHSIPDVGLTYRLWKPDGNGGGEMVASLPSQMGLLLNEMTGGVNRRDMDPTVRQDYSVVAAGGGAGPWYGRVFAANLANGDRVLGVATHVSWGNRDREENKHEVFNGLAHDGSVGLAFAHRIMDRPVGAGGAMTQMDINTIYMNFQQRVSAPVHVHRNVTIEPGTGLQILGGAIEGGAPGDRGWTGDGDMRWNLSLRGTYESTDARTRVSAEGGTQLTLGLEDIRGLLASPVIPVVNHSYVRLDAEHLVSPDIRLNAGLLYVMREYGDTFQATAGATIDSRAGRTSLTAGFLTPVGQANGFQPGGAHPALSIGLAHSILRDDRQRSILDINTTYTQNLDDGNFMFHSGAALHW